MKMIEINHLSKRFGRKQVLQDLTFSVPKGSVVGFVGENGAGKTTTMKAILGLLPIDEGEIIVCGEQWCNSAQPRPIVGSAIYRMYRSFTRL